MPRVLDHDLPNFGIACSVEADDSPHPGHEIIQVAESAALIRLPELDLRLDATLADHRQRIFPAGDGRSLDVPEMPPQRSFQRPVARMGSGDFDEHPLRRGTI